MITNLLIRNIQSHERSDFAFHPGVNIIIGESDSGKSAILRALRWLFDNRPSGNAIQSKFIKKGDSSVVKIWEGENRSASKEMQNGKSKYILHSQIFEAVGTTVPEEVSKFFNMSGVNLQRQLDSPFLLADTPGAVAQHFNKIGNLDKIDTSTSFINSAIRELNAKISYKESEIKTAEEELKKFEYLEKLEMEIEALEELQKRWLSKVLNKNSLDKLIRGVQHIDVLIDNASPLLELEEEVNQIFQWKDKLETNKKNRTALWSVLSSINLANDDIEYQNQLAELETPVNNLLSLYTKLNTAETQRKSLDKALTYLRAINTQLKISTGKRDNLQAKLDELKICPFCGTKLK